MDKAENAYQFSLTIRERLSNANPAQFEPDLAFTLTNLGHLYQITGKFEDAKRRYSQALALRQNSVVNGQFHFKNELIRTYNNMAQLRDSFVRIKDYINATAIQHERSTCMDSMARTTKTFISQAVQDYGLLSLYYIFLNKYPESQAASERVLSLDPTQNWARINLGHSHLLRGKWPKAKQVYQEYLKNEPDPAEAKKTLSQAWVDLEAAGITCPGMTLAYKWLKE